MLQTFELYWPLTYCNFYNYCRITNPTGSVSISAFASLFVILIGITSSAIGLKICAITAGIKKYKSIIKEKKKKNNKIVLLAKSKLNSMEVLISKALVDSNIIHDEFVLINDVLKEFHDMKDEIKNFNNKWKFKLYKKQHHLTIWSVENIQKVKI